MFFIAVSANEYGYLHVVPGLTWGTEGLDISPSSLLSILHAHLLYSLTLSYNSWSHPRSLPLNQPHYLPNTTYIRLFIIAPLQMDTTFAHSWICPYVCWACSCPIAITGPPLPLKPHIVSNGRGPSVVTSTWRQTRKQLREGSPRNLHLAVLLLPTSWLMSETTIHTLFEAKEVPALSNARHRPRPGDKHPHLRAIHERSPAPTSVTPARILHPIDKSLHLLPTWTAQSS